MLELLSRYWWTLGPRGLSAVAFGLIALIWPAATLSVLVLLFGAYALIDGLFALGGALFGGSSIGDRRGWLVLEGIVGIATGVITVVWPSLTTTVLVSLVATWAILTGVLEIATAVRLRGELTSEWLMPCGLALRLRRHGQQLSTAPTEHGQAVPA